MMFHLLNIRLLHLFKLKRYELTTGMQTRRLDQFTRQAPSARRSADLDRRQYCRCTRNLGCSTGTGWPLTLCPQHDCALQFPQYCLPLPHQQTRHDLGRLGGIT